MAPQDYKAYLNIQEGLERIRGNQKVYKTLLNSFAQKDLYGQLITQLDSGDINEAARTAHAIKGTAGNMSMPALYEAAIALEKRLLAGESASDSMEEFAQIMKQTNLALNDALERLNNGEVL